MSDFRPADLRCEGLENPIATTTSPLLSWSLSAAEETRGLYQKHWQVLVASSAELLEQNEGDLWDSGKTAASRSPHVRYAGSPLEAGQVCYWKVRSWNQEGTPSAWSKPAKWEVGLTAPTDWAGATWIDDGKDNPEKDEDFYLPDPAPLLRKEFALEKPIRKARLHVAGLGLCYPSLNGQRLADQVFDPQWTNFDKRILYRTHDVTADLLQGENALGLELGNGWYNPLPMRMWGNLNLREHLPVGRPRAIALLVVEHTDGTTTTITTGPGWTTTEGPTLRNNLYLGEVYDARIAETLHGWNTPGFEENGWDPVRVRGDFTLATLKPLMAPPVRLKDAHTGSSVTEPEEATYIVDFGVNFTGLPELDLIVSEGTQIELRFGEALYEDGSLNPLSSVCGQIKRTKELEDGTIQSIGGPGAPVIAWQGNTYIAKGGGETYRPNFTFHGFRYMEIKGLPYKPEPEDFRGYPIRSDLKTSGQFSSSNELFNRIQEVSLQTFLANVVTVQSDCPHRERFAYGGDIVATSDAFFMNFDMQGFYTKTVYDWADAILPDGRLTDTAPFIGLDYCGVGWAMTHPLLLEQLHQYYGAEDLIEKQLENAMGWLDAVAADRENLLLTTGLGDHEALTENNWGGKLTTPVFIENAHRLARLARLAGEPEMAARAEKYAEETLEAWRKDQYDPETGIPAELNQTMLTFALRFAESDAATKKKIFDAMVKDLNKFEDGPRLTTGIFGTMILLEELSKNGRADIAYELATREAFPSWGWMLKNGATTLWERWVETDGRYSLNHPMFGSISTWFYRWLGGIQPADDAVAFDRFHIRPQVLPDLDWVKTSYESIRGPIVSNWSTSDAATSYEIVVPLDSTAFIELSMGELDTVMESGKPLQFVEALEVLEPKKPGTILIKAGSGHYQFKVNHIYCDSCG